MNSGLVLADHITLDLRSDIIVGRLLPGMALVENDLESTYNASRKPFEKSCIGWGSKVWPAMWETRARW